MDPPCPLGPSLSMEEKKRCPMDPPPHVQWEEERLRRSCGPERCFLPTCVHCDWGCRGRCKCERCPAEGVPISQPFGWVCDTGNGLRG